MDAGSKIFELLSSIFVVAAGVAIVSVLVSRNSQTSGVLQAWFSGTSNLLAVAESPVTGASVSVNTSYPGSSNAFGDLGTPSNQAGFANF